MKIVLCSSEVFPFVKTGGLADVCGSLPLALEEIGEEVSIFLPYYKAVSKGSFNIQKIADGLFSTAIGKKIKVYFIENDEYFGRSGLYGDPKDYPDNLQRFQFFCSQVLVSLKKLNIKADIVHCHDWQTGLIPVYLKTTYKHDRFFSKVKTVMTIHNLAYQGVFPANLYEHLKLDKALFSPEGLEFYGKINLLKAGIIFSDSVTTVSPRYAKEILTKDLGCGLEGVLQSRADRPVGILNGLDYKGWDPEHDPYLKFKYSAQDLKNKPLNKEELQRQSGLAVKKDIPVFGYVGRLAHQKGFDLLAEAIDDIIHLDLQLIILGVGEEKYHKFLKDLVKRYTSKVACYLTFDESTAHAIYAGSDIFLMPSWYEPCGLSQMISLRYGTIPLAHRTGGLVDTIVPFTEVTGEGYGFIFDNYSPKDLARTVKTAIAVYHKKEVFRRMIERGLKLRFSWDNSAQKYKEVFQQCLSSV